MNVRGWMLAALLSAGVTGSAWGQEQGTAAKPSTPAKAAKPAAEKTPRTAEGALTPEPHSPKRHDGFMERKKQGPIDLLFIGDSITDGWPKKSPETWKTWEKYHVADFGVSGDRTEHVLWRIAHNELDDLPDVKAVVLMIGTNNVGQIPDEKPEWAAAGVKKVLDEIHDKLPKAKVLLLGVFPHDEKPDGRLRTKVAEINKIISKFGDDRTTYMDIGQKFLEPDGTLSKEIMPDFLHPNDKGYHIWRDAIEAKVEEMMK